MISFVHLRTAIVGLALAAAHSLGTAADGFTRIVIDPPFDAVLQRNKLLMESGGAKIVVNPDGSRLVIGVGQVAYDKNAPAQQRLHKEKVARGKALIELTAQTSPIQIVHRETVAEQLRIETLEGGEQRSDAIEKYLSESTSSFQAVVKGLPVVGKWYSSEEDIMYVAIGKEFPAPTKTP
jgi:hypothetical protein